jgi:hypothetical protein
VDVGILKQINVGKRNRAFEAPEIIEAFTDLEDNWPVRKAIRERANQPAGCPGGV